MKLLHELDSMAGRNLVHVVVETVQGSNSKFKYDPGNGHFLLHRAMPQGMVFPHDYGFIPSTLGGDGDPLDVLLLNDTVAFPGCLVQARPIGVIEGHQTEKKTVRNDCLLAIAATSIAWAQVSELDELPRTMVEQIESFFVNYRKLQAKKFSPLGRRGSKRAWKLVHEAEKRFREHPGE